MAMRNPYTEFKNLLQDALMKIPFFIAEQQTNILAMPASHSILNHIQDHPSIISKQTRLFFLKEEPQRTLILQFDSVENAKLFKKEHEIKQSQNDQQQSSLLNKFNQSFILQNFQSFKTTIFFCEDTSFLDGILYQCGRVAVIAPQSCILESIINQVAKMIVVEGVGFEEELLNQAKNQQCLDFINHKLVSSENIYYRWRVYSYLQGDRQHSYRNQCFQLVENGATWYPPQKVPKYTSKILNLQERVHFTKLLRTLTTHKKKVEELMVFCIFNIDAAIDICSIITVVLAEKVFSQGLDEEKLVPYFYLLSDIFFNSPTAIYRDIMSVILPNLFLKISEKISQFQKLLELIDIWKKKYIFEEDYFKGLTWIFGDKNMRQSKRVSEEINIKSTQQIEAMCYSYGLPYFYLNEQKNKDNLALMLSDSGVEEREEKEPSLGAHDGEQLAQKDILRIKNKQIKAITCEGTTIRSLFDKSKNSISIDRD